jgi:hypothetical protein
MQVLPPLQSAFEVQPLCWNWQLALQIVETRCPPCQFPQHESPGSHSAGVAHSNCGVPHAGEQSFALYSQQATPSGHLIAPH